MADREKLKARFEELKASMEAGLFGTVGMDEVEAVLELIRETEPRVLTIEEMKRIEPGTVYWGEGHHVRNLWPMAFTDEAIKDLDSGLLKDSYGRVYELSLYNFGAMGWRLWTARPTEEQREAVKWNEEP